ncbi:molybdenum cofactor biosynthesis protein A [Haemophilus influenzae 3655]|uniref:Molybdenum cofactor biosynthesis protein A n=1 Tax=Haemophilus influenzae (strain NTHi 3655) TaxID=375177 RepID=A0A0H3PDE2_HAEI3|nr:molybdenum cofactor biosynthesis protein A [Haemophilus influenzae 3655]
MIFESVCNDFEAKSIEFDGEDAHVHLLIEYPPKVAVSTLVNSLKGVSSRMIRKKNYPSIRKKLWGNQLWSSSYFARYCGNSIPICGEIANFNSISCSIIFLT